MAVASYGTTNPRGLEPWPIESTLAPLAVGNDRAQAQNMLDMYQMQRGAAANVYGEDLQAQHDYAYQQLAQQMAEARLKATPELLKTPGGASLLGPGGIPGMGQDTDPGVMQDAMARANAAVAAENLQKSGTGLNQLSQGGYGTTPQTASGITGLPIPAYSGPALAQAATIRGQYQLAGDRIKAAAGQPKGLGISFDAPSNAPITPQLGGATAHVAFNPKLTVEQNLALARQQGALLPTSVDKPPGITNPPPLPSAQKDTTATSTPATQTPTPQKPTEQQISQVQNRVHIFVSGAPTNPQDAQKFADIKAGYVAGKPNIVPAQNGGLAVKGKSGALYQ